MISIRKNWNKFIFESDGDYINLIINEKEYCLPKKIKGFGKKNLFFIEFEINEVLKENFIEDLEKVLIKLKIKELHLRLKPLYNNSRILKKSIDHLIFHKYKKKEINLILLNLNNDEKVLRSNLRKSYKSLINKEDKTVNIRFSNSFVENETLFNDWKNIYSDAILRGNKIIPDKAYDHLKLACDSLECLISVAYENNIPIGGMLFSIDKDYAIYNSSLNIPKIEHDKKRSVGHCLMWHSIMELKKLGIKNFELGTFYDESSNSEHLKKWAIKEKGITNFKNGFGASIVPIYYFEKENIK
jgi:hypothetical protein